MSQYLNQPASFQPTLKEKLLASLGYLSLGMFSFIFLILRQHDSRFALFHAYQSLVLGVLFLLLRVAFDTLLNVLAVFLYFSPPIIAFLGFIGPLFSSGLWFVMGLLLAYCLFTLWKGSETYIKWLSPQVERML